MTKKLEDLFNLPENTKIPKPKVTRTAKKTLAQDEEERDNAFGQMQEIIKGNHSKMDQFGVKSDIELDEIAQNAMDTYNQLIELGANVDSRYSARIFEVAGSFLKISLDAKTAKVNKVLRSAELEIRQGKTQGGMGGNHTIGVDHVVSDRNSLLEKLRNLN